MAKDAELKTYRIATIPGDGIGKEVIPAGQQVLQTLAAQGDAFSFAFETFETEIEFWTRHIEEVLKYTREQAIAELISALKVHEKIASIRKFVKQLPKDEALKANASLFPKNRTSGRFAGNGLCRAYSCKFAQWANV